VATSDILVRSISGEPSRPASDRWKLATGGMVSDLDGSSSRYVSKFYEQAREIEQAYATYREMVKSGNLREASEYATEHMEELSKHGRTERVRRELQKLNQQRRGVEANASLSASEKRERINRIKERQDKLARAAG
jgi:hypothetical protein